MTLQITLKCFARFARKWTPAWKLKKKTEKLNSLIIKHVNLVPFDEICFLIQLWAKCSINKIRHTFPIFWNHFRVSRVHFEFDTVESIIKWAGKEVNAIISFPFKNCVDFLGLSREIDFQWVIFCTMYIMRTRAEAEELMVIDPISKERLNNITENISNFIFLWSDNF